MRWEETGLWPGEVSHREVQRTGAQLARLPTSPSHPILCRDRAWAISNVRKGNPRSSLWGPRGRKESEGFSTNSALEMSYMDSSGTCLLSKIET